jgi:S1-C subfamily serine protease
VAGGKPPAEFIAAEQATVNVNGQVPGGAVAGTGMVLTPDGMVLTNNHVIAGTTALTGQVDGTGRKYDATVIGVDPTHDVAVIRLQDASGLPTMPFETSGVVGIGDAVTTMGNALGGNGVPVSASGAVTSLDETLMVSGEGGDASETLNGLIRFNAGIQPGDSGGPLLNRAGHAIGMDTAGSSATHASAGGKFGAAIPINAALSIAGNIMSGKMSPYIEGGHAGILGVAVADAPAQAGARVRLVAAHQAADVAGIVPGDVIVDIAGGPVQSVADLSANMKGRRPDARISVTWVRGTSERHVATVALSAGPPA